jgi:small subunit ribosomal protein S17
VGTVVSDRMQKTVVVVVERFVEHPVYKKHIRRRSKLYAHDEKGACHVGDTVIVIETRPLSKLKCWRVLEIVTRAK